MGAVLADFPHIPLVACVGLVIGFFAPLTASGGFLVVAFLLALGLPPQTAIACAMFASIGSASMSFMRLQRDGKVVRSFLLPMIALTVIGNATGSFIVVNMPEEMLRKIVGVLMIFAASIIAFQTKLGVETRQTTRPKTAMGLFLYTLCSVYAGFFVGGSGVMQRFIALTFFGFTIMQSAATGALPWVFAASASSVVFAWNGYLDFSYALPLLLSMGVGAYIGANTGLKHGEEWVKGIFVGVTYLTAIYFFTTAVLF
ncbi:MAG: sulfite exporter TauE/SafE family protein [Alphaproteobacteria bacterium]|nr:MAG: sulfite exporter TauE/SafE family protein [Alphaproteobacteria bacterium]